MSAILQNDNVVKGFRVTVDVVKTVWAWTRDRLWPIYSAAILLSVFEMLAASSEKQILADHYYGGPASEKGVYFGEEKSELIADSKKQFNEEVTLSIRERVWQMPSAAFQSVYADRLGSQ